MVQLQAKQVSATHWRIEADAAETQLVLFPPSDKVQELWKECVPLFDVDFMQPEQFGRPGMHIDLRSGEGVRRELIGQFTGELERCCCIAHDA